MRLFVEAEQVEGNVAQSGQIGGGVPGASPAAVFLEGHIEAPVELIFDAPVSAHGAGKAGDVQRQAAEVVAAFRPRGATDDFAHGFGDPDAPEVSHSARSANQPRSALCQ